MAMSFMMMFTVFLVGGDLFTGLLEAPPRDFASLIEPVPALQQMQQDTSEDALIALIRQEPAEAPEEALLEKALENLGHEEFDERQKAAQTLREAGKAARPYLEKAARSPDPEVRLTAENMLEKLDKERQASLQQDTEYAKKLLAVRALQQMESRKALPVLKQLAESDDITLAAAAADAVAIIQGGEPRRPSGAEAMNAIARRLPADTAVCVIGEFVTGARQLTLAQFVEKLVEQTDDNQAFFRALGTTAAHMKASIEGMKGMGSTQFVQMLSMTGNFRVDAAAMVIPSGWTDNPDYMWVAWVFKGLYDPDRIQRVLQAQMGRHTKRGRRQSYREIHGVPVYGSRYDPHVALVDKNTLVIVVGDVDNQDQTAAPILRALTGEPRDELAPAVQDALAQFQGEDAGDVRIGFGGRMFLSPSLVAEGRREIKQEIAREVKDQNPDLEDRIELAFMRLGLSMLDLEKASGRMTNDGRIALTGQARAPANATDLAMALKGVNDVFADTAKKLTEGAGDGMKDMFAAMQKGPIKANSDGREVTAQTSLPELMEHITMLVFSQIGQAIGQLQQDRAPVAAVAQPIPAP